MEIHHLFLLKNVIIRSFAIYFLNNIYYLYGILPNFLQHFFPSSTYMYNIFYI
jgi:hypothetical protein